MFSAADNKRSLKQIEKSVSERAMLVNSCEKRTKLAFEDGPHFDSLLAKKDVQV